MPEILISGSAFQVQALRGLAFKRRYELYENASAGSCGAVTLGAGVDTTAYPFAIASVRVPGSEGDPIRVGARWIRQTAPAIVELSISRLVMGMPFDSGESALIVSLAGADLAENEEAFITDGQILITSGGF